MNEILAVSIPFINPNEPEALLAALHVAEGQQVAGGDLLCTLETTKETTEVAAERPGFVVGLRFRAGETVRAGDLLCYLADSPNPGALPPAPAAASAGAAGEPPLPPGLRITRPALELARRHGLDLAGLQPGQFVTEQQVQALLDAQASQAGAAPPASAFEASALLIYGGGGHGKMVIDLLRGAGAWQIAGVVDDGLPGGSVLGAPVLGGGAILPELYARGLRLAVNAVGGIGNVGVRIQIFQRLAGAGFGFPVLVHTAAIVEPSARISPGAQVFARAYAGSEAHIGFGCIVNTGAIVSHDCRLEDFAILSPGAILAGEVQVGRGALIGMGATVNLRVKIGAGARVGNGATVKSDVPARGIVPAGSVWPV